MIRRKTKSYDLYDNIQPNLVTLDGAGIQNAIKSRMTRPQFLSFIERKMSEDNMLEFKNLMDLEGSFYADIPLSERKYVYDLSMAVLYEELMDFSELKSMVSAEGSNATNILERMIVLEYDLYFLEGSIGTTQEFDKVYIIDNIRDIFYGTEERESYKDLTNLNEELAKILAGASKPTEIPSDFYTTGTNFNPNLLFRVNRAVADIEGTNSAKYSFLLNYNTTSSITDRSLARKYEALTSGYYYKNGTKKYFTGLSGYSYYGLLSGSHNSDYEAAHTFLVDLWDRMRDGTINY